MFIRDLDPRRVVVFDARQCQYCFPPETAFRFTVAKPRMVSDKYRTDRYFIYNQDPALDPQMEKMNRVSRAVSTPDQSHSVSVQPSTTNSRGSGLPEYPQPNFFAPMPASISATTRNSRADGLPPSPNNWFNPTTASAGDCSLDQYGVYGGVSDGLYYDTHNAGGGSFARSTGGDAMPSYFDSSSSSTYHMNGSSPNTMFGSFSSSIGPPEDMDVDLSEFIRSPSSISAGTTTGHYSSVQRQNTFPNPPAPIYPASPNPHTTEYHCQTVSPSMLRLNHTPSLPMTSSSESLSLPDSYSPFRMDTDSSAVQSSTATTVPEILILPSSDHQVRRKASSKKPQRASNSSSKWGRKALPDRAPNSQGGPNQFILPNNGSKRRSEPEGNTPSKSHSKRSKHKNKGSSQSQLHISPSDLASSSGAHTSSRPILASSTGTGTDAASNPASAAERSAQDEFLVSSRLGGMKYSQIRKLGNFKEAESTLRGRFRTLVKPKEARVRNPQWQEIDDKLLKQAVPKHSKNTSSIPWKAVADYIFDNGGTYQFGYNTCHRRWNYLNETSDEQVKTDRTNGN